MAQLFTKQLHLVHNLRSDSLIVPDGKLWVIRTIGIFDAGVLTGTDFQIVEDATDATVYYHQTSLGVFSNYYAEKDLRLVFPTPTILHLTASNTIDVGLYGYELSLP